MAGKRKKVEGWMYLKAYQAARAGMSKKETAAAIGVSVTMLDKFMEENEDFADAIKKGRSEAKGKSGYDELKDFCYGRLPPRARKLWDRVDAVDKLDHEENPDKPALMEEAWRAIAVQPELVRMKLFLHALVATNFTVTAACRVVGMAKSEIDRWVRESPAFAELFAGVQEAKKDFFEGGLVRLVRAGDSAATIFANRTVNRDRGYGEKIVVDSHKTQEITHRVKVDDLPIEVRRYLLDQQRGRAPQLEDRSDIVDAEVEEKT